MPTDHDAFDALATARSTNADILGGFDGSATGRIGARGAL